ncbi:MAG: acyl-CoA dehydrogenase family protein [Anaerolineales bacterium]
MISFEQTDDQRAFAEAVHRFAAQDMRKSLRSADESGVLPAQLLETGWNLGIVPAGIPEDYGGFADEQPALTAAIAYEELGWGDLSAAFQLLTPTQLAHPVREFGSAAQKQAYLPRAADGEAPALVGALIEPRYQFNPRALDTTATREGDLYTLNGRKANVALADSADTFLVYANEGGATQAFIIEKTNPGIAIGAREQLMGIKALPTYPLTLENCRAPAECRLGEDEGCDIGALLSRSDVALASLAVGVARAAFEYATTYAKEREAFGEPIAQRQSIAFMLAEMAIEVDAARLMAWEAAWRLDRGDSDEEIREAATLARVYANDMVVGVADRAVQILGGHGYIREHPVELWLRNARGFATFDGMAFV